MTAEILVPMLDPLVSIVTATYNRSNVLRHTLASVRASTVTRWEHVVVGDACTDDTAAVVASFDDPRIRFVNLPRNCGEQSGPNSEGLRLSSADVVAMLNHDDLWTPHHLDVALRALARTGADLVYTTGVTIDGRGRLRVSGVGANGGYDRRAFVPASTWVFRRGLFEEIGPWRPAGALHVSPSTDWLDRAWRAGKRLVHVPDVTTILIMSGGRRGSYSERQSFEHDELARRLAADPRALEALIAGVAVERTRELLAVWPLIGRAAKNGLTQAIARLGVHPTGLHHALRYRRRGGFLDALRRTRGLGPLRRTENGR